MAELADALDLGSNGNTVQVRPLLPAPEKVRRASAGLFQLNPSWRTGEIHLRWMKSLRDEIRLCRVKRTDLISLSAKCSISSEGFARRFHRGAPQGPRNELAEFWGKGQCLDFTYHTILRLNMGCSAPAEMCFSQVRYRYLHQKVVGSAYEQHPQPRRRSRIERNHIPINARGGEVNSPPMFLSCVSSYQIL